LPGLRFRLDRGGVRGLARSLFPQRGECQMFRGARVALLSLFLRHGQRGLANGVRGPSIPERRAQAICDLVRGRRSLVGNRLTETGLRVANFALALSEVLFALAELALLCLDGDPGQLSL